MRVETVIDLLKEKGFKQYQFDKELMYQFEENNIDIWVNNERILMLKEYRTQNSLLDWEINDQASIATALHYLPKKYHNNLYFFMILDLNTEDTKLKLEINKIEKNDLICKKYILEDDKDLNRIPFLMNQPIENDAFAFDEKFKKRFMKFKDKINQEDNFNLDIVMEDYFNNYLNNKSASKIKIENLLDIGD